MEKKAFEKIQYSSIIKTLSEQVKEQNNLKLIKAICKNKSKKLQLTYTYWQKFQSFHTKIRTKAKMYPISIPFNIIMEALDD